MVKLVFIAAVLAVFVQSFDCAPSRLLSISNGTSSVTINGVTVQAVNKDGHVEYTINGKPATEQEAKETFEPYVSINISNGEINSLSLNERPMAPEDNKTVDKQMEELENNINKQMENMENQMTKMPMQKPGWPFNQ